MKQQLLLHFIISFSAAASVELSILSNGRRITHDSIVRLREETRVFLVVISQSKDRNISAYCEEKSICVAEQNRTDATNNNQSEVVLLGLFLGRSKLIIEDVSLRNHSGRKLIRVEVLRSKRGKQYSNILTLMAGILISISTFMMGTQLEPKIIWEVLKTPVGPLIGLCCQFLLMPLLAIGWGKLIFEGWYGFAYLAIGCSPGGGASNLWTIMLNGNIDLSVTMTFCSSMAAIAMMPAWLYGLGNTFHTTKATVHIPFERIGLSILFLVIPCCLGILLVHFKPKLAEKFRKIIKIFALIMLTFFLPFALYTTRYIFYLITWRTLAAGAALPWCGYAVGYFVARLVCRRVPRDAITIAIETGIQNGGIAILVIRFSLPEPDNDLTLVVPICVFLLTMLPLWLSFAANLCYKKIKGKPAVADAGEQTQDVVSATKAIEESIGKVASDANTTEATDRPNRTQSEESKEEEDGSKEENLESSSNNKRPSTTVTTRDIVAENSEGKQGVYENKAFEAEENNGVEMKKMKKSKIRKKQDKQPEVQ